MVDRHTTTVSTWSALMGISRQAGHVAVKRCGIPQKDGLLDPDLATLLYKRHTRPQLRLQQHRTKQHQREEPIDLPELAIGMIDVLREMNPADPEFDRGCRLLMGAVLSRLPEAMLQTIALPPFVADHIEALIDAREATP